MLDPLTAAARFLTFSGLLVLLGCAAFFGYGMSASQSAAPLDARGWQRQLALASAAVALGASSLWIIAEALLLSGDSPGAFGLSAIWGVLSETRFGRVGAIRCVALLVMWLSLMVPKVRSRAGWNADAVLAALLVASLAWTGHGTLGSGVVGWLHTTGDVLHLLTAGLWIGALVPLCLLANRAFVDPNKQSVTELVYGLDRFSAIGVILVAVLLLSGISNTWFLVGPAPWPDIGKSLYGRLVLVKIGLLIAMIALAAINRVRLAPRIRRAGCLPEPDRGAMLALRATLITETAAAFLTLGVVAILGTLEPAIEPD